MTIHELVQDVESEAAYRAAKHIHQLAEMMGRVPTVAEMARYIRDETEFGWHQVISKFERR